MFVLRTNATDMMQEQSFFFEKLITTTKSSTYLCCVEIEHAFMFCQSAGKDMLVFVAKTLKTCY